MTSLSHFFEWAVRALERVQSARPEGGGTCSIAFQGAAQRLGFGLAAQPGGRQMGLPLICLRAASDLVCKQ